MKTVLYVCVHNAGRSQMAEALTNALAKERGLPITALSAGTVAGTSVNPVAVAVMEEIGISMAGHHPKQLTQEMADSAETVITMGCGDACPVYPGTRYEDWVLDDPAGQPLEVVRGIRDDIRARVVRLLAELGVSA